MDGDASFRIPWGLQMIPAIILSIGMYWFPESPRWLFDHGREAEALEILADLHGGGDSNNELVRLEFEEIREQVEFERTQGAKSYLDLIKPGMFRRVSLGCSLQMWSQLSGMNIMMYVVHARDSGVQTLTTGQIGITWSMSWRVLVSLVVALVLLLPL